MLFYIPISYFILSYLYPNKYTIKTKNLRMWKIKCQSSELLQVFVSAVSTSTSLFHSILVTGPHLSYRWSYQNKTAKNYLCLLFQNINWKTTISLLLVYTCALIYLLAFKHLRLLYGNRKYLKQIKFYRRARNSSKRWMEGYSYNYCCWCSWWLI